jgi:hypothetical protein
MNFPLVLNKTEISSKKLLDYYRTIVYYRNMRTKDDSKKEAIFEATIGLLNEIGFANISMSKIAKSAENPDAHGWFEPEKARYV